MTKVKSKAGLADKEALESNVQTTFSTPHPLTRRLTALQTVTAGSSPLSNARSSHHASLSFHTTFIS